MPTKLLTDRFVAAVKAPAGRVAYFDQKVRGLVLRVGPRGRSWWFSYRLLGKPTQWIALPKDASTLSAARAAALTFRHQVDVDHRDPVAEAKAAKLPPAPDAPTVMTVGAFVPLYVRLASLTKRTWREDEAKLQKYMVPTWGARPLTEITRRDVAELLDGLLAKGLTVGVNRVQALISRFFSIALDRGLIDHHPCTRMIKRATERPRERVLTDDEITTLWQGLDAQPGPAADILKLRLLLGQRGGETAGMRWSEVDLALNVWAMPGERTKNARPQIVPLADTAIAILHARREAVPDDETMVFPPGVMATDPARALSALLPKGARWTDLRRTMATRLAGLGFSETVIGRCLNHARFTITMKHYVQHQFLGEMRTALETWDRELARIISGTPKVGAAVLPMAR